MAFRIPGSWIGSQHSGIWDCDPASVCLVVGSSFLPHASHDQGSEATSRAAARRRLLLPPWSDISQDFLQDFTTGTNLVA